MTDENRTPSASPEPDAATPPQARPPAEAGRRQAMERMLGLLAAAPAAALLFDPRRAEAWGDGSFE